MCAVRTHHFKKDGIEAMKQKLPITNYQTSTLHMEKNCTHLLKVDEVFRHVKIHNFQASMPSRNDTSHFPI